MVDELIKSVLMEYISPSDYDLHDWDTIIERRTQYSDDVYIYHCVYGDIYLTEDLEFYDAEPKQPIHNSLRNKLGVEDELIMTALCDYIPVEYRKDIDWQTIISRREQIKPNIYKYSINNIDFYMDDDLNPIEYGKIHIINNNIYYDFNLTDVKITPYVLFGEL